MMLKERGAILLIIVYLSLLVAGCSTSGRIISGDMPAYGNNEYVALRTEDNNKRTAQEEVTSPEKETRITTVHTIPLEEDDDIASLLKHDDFRDFDIPIVFNDAVKYYINYFSNEKRKVFANWLKRSRYYVPVIKEILRENGLPEDLVYLAMIESGFNPKAYSRAKASGPWQFIYSTGGRYGLKVNYWIDERRDPEKSTIAATKYLKDLFNQFGCWYLAAAGYNAGERRVERAIERHNTNDFWELAKYNALPRETREYIPKLIAAAIIAKDPERFGFGSITYDEPIKFVTVKVPRATLLATIAKANDMDLSELKSINPEILRGITPPNTDHYAIKLPAPVDLDRFQRNLEVALRSEKKVQHVVTYKVKKTDTLAKIIKRYGIQERDVCLVNDCENGLKLYRGMALNIPRYAKTTKATAQKSTTQGKAMAHKDEQEINVKPSGNDTVEKNGYHIVKKGETLASISNKYGIDIASIKRANNLKGDTLYPNMKLKLAGYSQKKEKPKIKYHIVKKGETLASISNKYGIDVETLKETNNLKTNKITPKKKLKIVLEES